MNGTFSHTVVVSVKRRFLLRVILYFNGSLTMYGRILMSFSANRCISLSMFCCRSPLAPVEANFSIYPLLLRTPSKDIVASPQTPRSWLKDISFSTDTKKMRMQETRAGEIVRGSDQRRSSKDLKASWKINKNGKFLNF